MLFINKGGRIPFINEEGRMLSIDGGMPFVDEEGRILFIEEGRMTFMEGGSHFSRQEESCPSRQAYRSADAVHQQGREDTVNQGREGHHSSRERGSSRESSSNGESQSSTEGGQGGSHSSREDAIH